MNGRFYLQVTTNAGIAIGDPIECKTSTGVMVAAPRMNPADVSHLCELARHGNGVHVDMCLWDDSENPSYLLWSARLSWIDDSLEMQ